VLTATHMLGLRAWVLRLRVTLGLLLCGWGAGAWAETVQSLTRPSRSTWVVDGTGTLADETLAELDGLGSEVKRSGLGQLVVVVVFTTEGRAPRTFATELFNRWGIGHGGRHDGVLLFIALRDRKAEIILGEGVDTPEDVARSKELMRERIVPALREGALDVAVLEGARGLQELLESAPLNQGLAQGTVLHERLALSAPSKPVAKDARKPLSKKGASPPAREPRKEFLDDEGMYVELSTSSSSAGEDAPSSTPVAGEQLPSSESSPASSTQGAGASRTSSQSPVAPWAWAVVGGFMLLLIIGNLLRRRGVACERCGARNVKVSTTTLVEVGDHHEGLVEVVVRCRRCGHVGTSTRETSPRGHSHSHRGAHGGGRSSGGGASGSW